MSLKGKLSSLYPIEDESLSHSSLKVYQWTHPELFPNRVGGYSSPQYYTKPFLISIFAFPSFEYLEQVFICMTCCLVMGNKWDTLSFSPDPSTSNHIHGP